MKHYTVKFNNTKNNSNFSFRNLFRRNSSKTLDDIILSNLVKMNPYLKKTYSSDPLLDAMFDDAGLNTTDNIIVIPNRTRYLLKDDIDLDFITAANFLSSYTPEKKYYTLFDNTPVVFFEDEIQIGYDLIPLDYLRTPKYYNTFTTSMKKTIINIFISINR